jgi:hypothetical protein
MRVPPGAGPAAAPEDPGLAEAAGDFAGSANRYLRALTGLLGLELRESGAQALLLVTLGVGFIIACTFAYLFFVTAVSVLLALCLGCGLPMVLGGLCAFHLFLALALLLVLRSRARQPMFPGTREALRRGFDPAP